MPPHLRLAPLLLLAASLLVGTPAAAQTSASGSAVAIGGALKYDNDAVWQKLVDLAGGPGARFVVLASASGDPEKSAAAIVQALNRRGASAEHLPVAPLLKGSDYKAAARDPVMVAKVRAATGVFFAGGAQERITQALLDETGGPTPVLAAIWDLYRAGGVVAGSSAGAAIMSTTMFRDAQDVLTVMKSGMKEGREIDQGLGFVGPDVFVDQHFLKRGRFGRMLPLMLRQGYKIGVGVDENTAAVFRGDTVEIVGYKGALLIDLSDASTDRSQPAFNVRGARLSYLDRNDRYNLKTQVFTPSPEKLKGMKIDPNAGDFKPYFKTDAFHADVLGDTAVVNLMANLIDNKQAEVIGLAFNPAARDRPELGFEFRFHKRPDSVGYYSGAFGGEDYSVMNIVVDVTPIIMSRPLYRPLLSQ